MFTSCRVNKRYAIKAMAKVFQGGRMLEMAIRDISVAGIGLVAADAAALAVGSVCFVTLPRHEKVDAIVVAARHQNYHMQFLAPNADDLRELLDPYADETVVAHGMGPAARVNGAA